MTKSFKAHPLMILKFIRPNLVAFILPIAEGVIQYLTKRNFKGVAVFSVAVLIFVLAAAVLTRHSYKLIFDFESRILTVEYGFFLKRFTKIDIRKLSSVQSTQNPLDYIFGAVTFKINTEAGGFNNTDFWFKLSVKDSKEVSDRLYKSPKPQTERYSAGKVAALSLATSSALTGTVVAVPIINRAASLFGGGVKNMPFYNLHNLWGKFNNYFPPVINTATVIILAAYFISFVFSFFKNVKFKLLTGEKNLEVISGLVVKTRTSFRKSAINNIKTEQTLLMHLLRRYALKVSVGGYGDSKSESEIIVPLGTKKEISQKLAKYFPFIIADGDRIRPKRGYLTKSRFLFMPAVWWIAVSAVSVVSALLFKEFAEFIIFLTVVACGYILCTAYIGLFEYNRSQISFGDSIFAKSGKGLRTYELYCPKENIGEIRMTRFIPDRRHKTCRVRIFVRSERADNIRVRNLDYEAVKNSIYKCFNIE